MEYDKDTFRGKVVYSNCDDPFESNFFRYFALNFNRLGLKQLITTSYKPSPIANTQLGLFGDDKTDTSVKDRSKVTANKLIINEVSDIDGDGAFNLQDIAEQLKANKNNEWAPLDGDGDFRSPECTELLKQSDIIVTNPPFSLFREYVKQLFDYDKKFVIIGNKNCVTYKEIFPLIRDNKMWSGRTGWGGGLWFETMNADDVDKVIDGVKMKNVSSVWFTNLDHGKRHENIPLMSMSDNLKYSRHKEIKGKTAYNQYDNYDAIDVSYTDAIPNDYPEAMGVPISFIDKYNPEQFEIIGLGIANLGLSIGVKPYKPEHRKYRKEVQKRGTVDGDLYMMSEGVVVVPYARVLVKHRKVAT